MPAAIDRELIEGSMAELVEKLGDIPLHRILMQPYPGTATEKDVLKAEAAPRKRLCELIDGVLVEKAMGFPESVLAGKLCRSLGDHVDKKQLGIVAVADGMMTMWPGRVRIPDVSFISWDRLPGRRVPTKPIPEIAPDLAVEILSKSNTRREMELKRLDYFRVGCRLVWEIDPKTKTADVYTSLDDRTRLRKNGILDGADVVPGFTLPLAQLFAELDRHG